MRLWLTPPLLVLSSITLAQAPAPKPTREPSPATADRQLDDLKRQHQQLGDAIKRLERERRAAPATPAPTAAVVAPKKVIRRPGWVVSVFPKPAKGLKPASVGRFIARPSGFRFGDLRKTLPFQGWASFQADGLYNVKPEGRGSYTFSVALRSEESKSFHFRVNCEVGLKVADQEVLLPENNSVSYETQGEFQRAFTGAVNLEPNAHPVVLNVTCYFNNGRIGQTADDFFDGPYGIRNVFDAIQVAVTIFGPNDMQARPPRDDELLHNVLGGEP